VPSQIQAIRAGISQISTSFFPAQESQKSFQAGLEAGAFPVLSVTVELEVSSPKKKEERMHLNVAKEVAALEAMNVAELRARYAQVFGEEARVGHKTWLVRRIAWRLQALAEGDLSERARRRAAELANDADLRLIPPRSVQSRPASESPDAKQERPDPRLPAPGQTLRRLYKGRALHVRILPKGFEFEGVVYRSLSAVAKAITGSHTNGFLFFDLLGKGDAP
jgi:hypothetical protein